MGFLDKLFGSSKPNESQKTENEINQFAKFWDWFAQNSQDFHRIVDNQDNIEPKFLDPLSEHLAPISKSIYFLTGMKDAQTAELIFTADGNPEAIHEVEDLVNAAPPIPNWLFTALKQPTDLNHSGIGMDGLKFSKDTLSFVPRINPDYPDEINIGLVHKDCTAEDIEKVKGGGNIFLDLYLGELDFLEKIDRVEFLTPNEVPQEDLVPIEKLKDFIDYRQSEFLEKYKSEKRDTTNDSYSMLEANLNNGRPLLAVVNTSALKWDAKASMQWVAFFTVKFNGDDNNGLPDNKDFEALNAIEDEISEEMEADGNCVYVGRETADGIKESFYACKNYRIPARIFKKYQQKYQDQYEITYEIIKDKYWRSLEKYMPQ